MQDDLRAERTHRRWAVCVRVLRTLGFERPVSKVHILAHVSRRLGTNNKSHHSFTQKSRDKHSCTGDAAAWHQKHHYTDRVGMTNLRGGRCLKGGRGDSQPYSLTALHPTTCKASPHDCPPPPPPPPRDTLNPRDKEHSSASSLLVPSNKVDVAHGSEVLEEGMLLQDGHAHLKLSPGL